MSVLNQLEVVPAAERVRGYDPIRVRRKKLASALQEQLNLLTSAGERYRRVRIQRKRDLETDEMFDVSASRRVVPWWSFDDAGQVRFGIRYGSVLLKLRGDDSVIVLPCLEALEALIPDLCQEALRGELDGPLAVAAGELTARFKRKAGGARMKA